MKNFWSFVWFFFSFLFLFQGCSKSSEESSSTPGPKSPPIVSPPLVIPATNNSPTPAPTPLPPQIPPSFPSSNSSSTNVSPVPYPTPLPVIVPPLSPQSSTANHPFVPKDPVVISWPNTIKGYLLEDAVVALKLREDKMKGLRMRLLRAPQFGKLIDCFPNEQYHDHLLCHYQPKENYHGEDFFIYELWGNGVRQEVRCLLAIAPVNDAPSAYDGKLLLNFNMASKVSFPKGIDVENDLISYFIVQKPTWGKLESCQKNSSDIFECEYIPFLGSQIPETDVVGFQISDAQEKNPKIYYLKLEFIKTVDSDGDGLDDDFEIRIGMDPHQSWIPKFLIKTFEGKLSSSYEKKQSGNSEKINHELKLKYDSSSSLVSRKIYSILNQYLQKKEIQESDWPMPQDELAFLLSPEKHKEALQSYLKRLKDHDKLILRSPKVSFSALVSLELKDNFDSERPLVYQGWQGAIFKKNSYSIKKYFQFNSFGTTEESISSLAYPYLSWEEYKSWFEDNQSFWVSPREITYYFKNKIFPLKISKVLEDVYEKTSSLSLFQDNTIEVFHFTPEKVKNHIKILKILEILKKSSPKTVRGKLWEFMNKRNEISIEELKFGEKKNFSKKTWILLEKEIQNPLTKKRRKIYIVAYVSWKEVMAYSPEYFSRTIIPDIHKYEKTFFYAKSFLIRPYKGTINAVDYKIETKEIIDYCSMTIVHLNNCQDSTCSIQLRKNFYYRKKIGIENSSLFFNRLFVRENKKYFYLKEAKKSLHFSFSEEEFYGIFLSQEKAFSSFRFFIKQGEPTLYPEGRVGSTCTKRKKNEYSYNTEGAVYSVLLPENLKWSAELIEVY